MSAENEVTGDQHEIEWLGHKLHLPASTDDWDINVTRAFQRDDIIGALEALIGPNEFAKVEAAHRKAHGGKFRQGDLGPLADQVAAVYGFESSGN